MEVNMEFLLKSGLSILKRRSCLCLAAILFGALSLCSPGAEYFVALGGSDSNGGTEWGDAFATISHAVAQADATEVTVSNGTYDIPDVITIGKAITIRSFGAGEYGGLPNATNTVVDRGYGSRVFYLSDAGIVLDGFTITRGGRGGKFVAGKGVYMTGGSLLNCIVKNNGSSSDISDGNAGGGGIFMAGGLVSNCTVQANQIVEGKGQGGAGIWAQGSSVIIGCRILDNSQTRPYECFGGGIFAQHATVKIQNCLVTGNLVRDKGGGIYGGTIVNCTVVSNRVSLATGAGEAGGVYLPAGHSLNNSIVYFNQVNSAHNNLNTTVGVGHSCFTMPDDTSNGNIPDNPLFLDLPGGDYRLDPFSPCKEAGDSSIVTWLSDLDGNSRIKGIVDMGAYELQPPAGLMIIIR